jgi:hypothetical protein
MLSLFRQTRCFASATNSQKEVAERSLFELICRSKTSIGFDETSQILSPMFARVTITTDCRSSAWTDGRFFCANKSFGFPYSSNFSDSPRSAADLTDLSRQSIHISIASKVSCRSLMHFARPLHPDESDHSLDSCGSRDLLHNRVLVNSRG